MIRDSKVISKNSAEIIKIVQESFANFREIKLSGLEKRFFNMFSKNEFKLRISDSNIRILSDLPRFVIEGLILSIIIVLSAIFLQSEGSSKIFNSLLFRCFYMKSKIATFSSNHISMFIYNTFFNF